MENFPKKRDFHCNYSRASFIGTLETRLLRRSIVPLTPIIEKSCDASTNCDDIAMTAVDSTDQSNASPQMSPIRWEPLSRPDKRVPTVKVISYALFHICSKYTTFFIFFDNFKFTI